MFDIDDIDDVPVIHRSREEPVDKAPLTSLIVLFAQGF